MWGAYLCVGAYKRDVVVVIKMVPIFMGAYFFYGCLLFRFYDTSPHRAVSICNTVKTIAWFLAEHKLRQNN